MPNTEIEICFYEVRELNPNKIFFSKCNYEYFINSQNEIIGADEQDKKGRTT